MNPVVGAISALALTLVTVSDESQSGPGTPAEQYAALLGEYRLASAGIRKAETDLQRKAAVARLGTFAPRFVSLFEEHAGDPIALTALRQAIQAVGSTDSAAQIAWETNRSDFPIGTTDDSVGKAVTLLSRDHLLSAELGPVCDRMRYGYRLEYDEFLRAVLRANPHRDVQAVACLSLAQFLNDRLQMIRLVEDRPDLTRRYAAVFGEGYLPDLRRLEEAGLEQRIETLLERATEYDDVQARTNVTVAEQARRELYALRHLAVGRVAPDIDGEDQHGEPFKLSDYRGRVVLLYFWMEF